MRPILTPNARTHTDEADACHVIPARITGVIAVGATTAHNRRASFSNHGPCVSLFAPGVRIPGASAKNDVDEWGMTGTSASVPLVAGELASFVAGLVDVRSDVAVARFMAERTDEHGVIDMACADGDAACAATTRRLLRPTSEPVGTSVLDAAA